MNPLFLILKLFGYAVYFTVMFFLTSRATQALREEKFSELILYIILFIGCLVAGYAVSHGTITELFPSNPFVTEQTISENENIIQIPDGYKFVEMDEDGRYYIIEDAEGNQQVIIIEKN